MQLIFLDLLATKELIDDVLSHVKTFGLETEFAMHVNDPFEKKSS